MMSHIRLKLTLASVILVAAVAYLAVAGLKEGSVYYMRVDAFTADSQYHNQAVRLSGSVAEGSVDRKGELMVLRFDLAGETSKVPVVYRGIVPDMFAPGRDVVVEGKLGEDGTFEADTLLTKCASKYESDADSPMAGADSKAKPMNHPDKAAMEGSPATGETQDETSRSNPTP